MLIFVIPLVSPKVAKSWTQTVRLFERCLRSVCNQTSSHFRVVVVCNERPDVQFHHPHLHYVEVNLPIPEQMIAAKTLDRGRKTLEGLRVAGQFAPSHVMFVDADDCISDRLTEFVDQHPDANGWLVSKGYIYRENTRYLYRVRRNFYDLCGTCNIIKYDLYDTQAEKLADADFVRHYYGGHTHIREMLKAEGNPLEFLPFEGAIYTVENGENYYNSDFNKLINRQGAISYLKTLRNYRLLTPRLRQQFGLYGIDVQEFASLPFTGHQNA